MRLKVPEWLSIDADKFRKHYEHLRHELQEMEDFARKYRILLPEAADKGGAVAHSERFAHMTLRNAAVTVLEEAGQPLHTSDLYDRLVAEGAEIGGEDPKNTLYGTLQGYDKVVKVGPSLWDLADRYREGEIDEF